MNLRLGAFIFLKIKKARNSEPLGLNQHFLKNVPIKMEYRPQNHQNPNR